MTHRMTVTLDDELRQAIEDAPSLLELPGDASDSEKLRAYARLGYHAVCESKLDDERLETYRRWANAPEMGEIARAVFHKAAARAVFTD
jgi:hypothetical protein